MSVRARTRRLPLNAEINVVSLIDVILLLLLIFMITAPMMTGGIPIQLPTASVQQIESKEGVLVEIDSLGGIYVEHKRWTMDQLRNSMKTFLQGKEEVTFRADARNQWGLGMTVMGILGNAGVKRFGLVAVPEDQTGK